MRPRLALRPVTRPAVRRLGAAVAVPLLLVGAACAPTEDADDTATEADPSASADAAADPAACAADAVMEPGTLTIGTDSPAYEPWFTDNDPTTGEGFESALAYEVADRLGFAEDAVSWVKVPFNTSYKPGPKEFDFDINQISITPERAERVDFSSGYYSAAQAVIALDGNPAAEATSIEDLKGLRLGAQTGTTSLTAIRDVIQPDGETAVFEDTNAAKQAMMNDQIDALLADLPTAFYITAVEIPKASIIGQFQPETGDQEEFGMLFEKGSPLVACVDAALAEMTEDGTLADLEQEWLSDTVGVPELR
ncbi:ABC transporter substrate-binding protein [Nocardioides solisilvae]|uniref:ABC transporter substrate-binding protein n=1 Tax=Nocardioides solisilvae TaxID=1542435 RepID=UPI000D746FFC|nr:ABC transporter substrate-binding protein [Nocardioides solisilvae]